MPPPDDPIQAAAVELSSILKCMRSSVERGEHFTKTDIIRSLAGGNAKQNLSTPARLQLIAALSDSFSRLSTSDFNALNAAAPPPRGVQSARTTPVRPHAPHTAQFGRQPHGPVSQWATGAGPAWAGISTPGSGWQSGPLSGPQPFRRRTATKAQRPSPAAPAPPVITRADAAVGTTPPHSLQADSVVTASRFPEVPSQSTCPIEPTQAYQPFDYTRFEAIMALEGQDRAQLADEENWRRVQFLESEVDTRHLREILEFINVELAMRKRVYIEENHHYRQWEEEAAIGMRELTSYQEFGRMDNPYEDEYQSMRFSLPYSYKLQAHSTTPRGSFVRPDIPVRYSPAAVGGPQSRTRSITPSRLRRTRSMSSSSNGETLLTSVESPEPRLERGPWPPAFTAETSPALSIAEFNGDEAHGSRRHDRSQFAPTDFGSGASPLFDWLDPRIVTGSALNQYGSMMIESTEDRDREIIEDDEVVKRQNIYRREMDDFSLRELLALVAEELYSRRDIYLLEDRLVSNLQELMEDNRCDALRKRNARAGRERNGAALKIQLFWKRAAASWRAQLLRKRRELRTTADEFRQLQHFLIDETVEDEEIARETMVWEENECRDKLFQGGKSYWEWIDEHAELKRAADEREREMLLSQLDAWEKRRVCSEEVEARAAVVSEENSERISLQDRKEAGFLITQITVFERETLGKEEYKGRLDVYDDEDSEFFNIVNEEFGIIFTSTSDPNRLIERAARHRDDVIRLRSLEFTYLCKLRQQDIEYIMKKPNAASLTIQCAWRQRMARERVKETRREKMSNERFVASKAELYQQESTGRSSVLMSEANERALAAQQEELEFTQRNVRVIERTWYHYKSRQVLNDCVRRHQLHLHTRPVPPSGRESPFVNPAYQLELLHSQYLRNQMLKQIHNQLK